MAAEFGQHAASQNAGLVAPEGQALTPDHSKARHDEKELVSPALAYIEPAGANTWKKLSALEELDEWGLPKPESHGLDNTKNRKPKFSVLMRLVEVEAPELRPYNPWRDALRFNHCKDLMRQLARDPSLIWKAYEGRTVLHVAVLMRCKPLLLLILRLCITSMTLKEMKDANGNTYYENRFGFQFGTKPRFYDLRWSPVVRGIEALFGEVDRRTKLTALQMEKLFGGSMIRYFNRYDEEAPHMDEWPRMAPYCPQFESVDHDVAESWELAAIKNVIGKLVVLTEDFRHLQDRFKQDSNLFFDTEIEFMFHYACGYQSQNRKELDFIEAVVKECLLLEANGDRVLEYLFKLQNSQGYIPFFLAIENHGESYLKDFLTRMPPDSYPSYSILLNACDFRGWSPIHKILTRYPTHEILEKLVKEKKINVNATLPRSNATALHFAILHDRPEAVKIILEADSNVIDVNAILERNIVYGSKCKNGEKRSSEYWSPLQLAAIMGHPDVVRILLTKIGKIYDSSKRNNHGVSKPKNYDDAIPALHLAAASGVPEVIRMFITNAFDPIKLTPHKRTPIHFAIDSSIAKFNNEVVEKDENINTVIPWATIEAQRHMKNPVTCVSDFDHPFAIEGHIHGIETKPDTKLHPTTFEDYEGRPACITMLLQAGVDIWQKDNEDALAEPGPEASTKLRLWWYEAIARDTSEAKKNLNDAANAISVVAALVATASYVGPLQPPLGYGTTDPSVLDLVQTTKLPIRVFVVSNCLSFYLAIGSILFAVVPSLPMPQESLYEEWQRSKRTIGIAILFLLMSLLGVLISFAAASNVGMEDHYSWQRSGLAFYPTIFGGLICLFGIIIFFVRLLRLVFDKNERIRRLYKKLPQL